MLAREGHAMAKRCPWDGPIRHYADHPHDCKTGRHLRHSTDTVSLSRSYIAISSRLVVAERRSEGASCLPGGDEIGGKPMTAKKKSRRAKSARHVAIRVNGIVLTPVRCAVEALIGPRLNGGWRWECPTISEVMDRLAGGRATRFMVRHWLNGRRRAPAWFIGVLIGELERQVAHRLALIGELKRLPTGDRRRSPEARARARAAMMKRLGRPVNEGGALASPQSDASTGSHPHTPEPK